MRRFERRFNWYHYICKCGYTHHSAFPGHTVCPVCKARLEAERCECEEVAK